jgi:hypothetical protein
MEIAKKPMESQLAQFVRDCVDSKVGVKTIQAAA